MKNYRRPIGFLHKPIDDAYTFSMKNYRRFRSYCFRILSLLHKLLSMIFLYSSMIASLFDCIYDLHRWDASIPSNSRAL